MSRRPGIPDLTLRGGRGDAADRGPALGVGRARAGEAEAVVAAARRSSVAGASDAVAPVRDRLEDRRDGPRGRHADDDLLHAGERALLGARRGQPARVGEAAGHGGPGPQAADAEGLVDRLHAADRHVAVGEQRGRREVAAVRALELGDVVADRERARRILEAQEPGVGGDVVAEADLRDVDGAARGHGADPARGSQFSSGIPSYARPGRAGPRGWRSPRRGPRRRPPPSSAVPSASSALARSSCGPRGLHSRASAAAGSSPGVAASARRRQAPVAAPAQLGADASCAPAAVFGTGTPAVSVSAARAEPPVAAMASAARAAIVDAALALVIGGPGRSAWPALRSACGSGR